MAEHKLDGLKLRKATKADDDSCARCKRHRVVMIAMQPGLDGKPWYLCSTCYV